MNQEKSLSPFHLILTVPLGAKKQSGSYPQRVLEPLACLWIDPPEVVLDEFRDGHQ